MRPWQNIISAANRRKPPQMSTNEGLRGQVAKEILGFVTYY
jgi:hypothetical protein